MKTNMVFYPCLCIIIFCLSFVGCGKTNYIVLRDVPQSPSFVVIPVTNTISEVSYANVVERAIIAAGVKVRLRPASRAVHRHTMIQMLLENLFIFLLLIGKLDLWV